WVSRTIGGLGATPGTSDDGLGVFAGFGFPTGIAIDSAGNVYVMDSVIRMGVPQPDPLRPSLRAVFDAHGKLSLSWTAVTGRNYQIQSAPDLSLGEWTSLGSSITATGGEITNSIAVREDPHRFYRVILLP